jgi:HD-GYP domain-containing protein (c-di-GMP phosphodiesterase class II)
MTDRPAPRPTFRESGDEDREARLGPELLARLHGVLRGLRLYDSSHQTMKCQIQELLQSIVAVMDDEASLIGMGDHFYLNGVRLRAQAAKLNLHRSLMAEFEVRTLSGLRFVPGLTAPELESFLALFLAARDAAAGERLPDEVQRLGILHAAPILTRDLGVQVTAEEAGAEEGAEGERQRAQKVFWRAIRGTESLVARAKQTGRPALHLARRLVQPVVDSILKNEYSIIGLTALKDHDEYTYAHCVNVSILSIGMGQAAGLPRQTLANLGVGALLHDLGKLAVPPEVLQKPGRLTDKEWAQVHRHPLEGVMMICHLPGHSRLTLDAMRAALQHHVNFDRSGYPKLREGSGQATLSRIVAVADFFDAVTSHRAYRPHAYTPFEALRFLMGSDRRRFDPAVLWAFIGTVGLYPAGSVLQTESNHVVVSLSPNPKDLRRPYCRVLRRPGLPVLDMDSQETWDPMPAHERVVRVLDARALRIDVNALLAA